MDLRVLEVVLVTIASACQPTAAPSAARSHRDAPVAPTPSAERPRGTVEFLPARSEGDVAQLVRETRARLSPETPALLVYVGATWCEPCRYFHQAVLEHRLDAEFPGLRLLEFDLDRDAERLAAAGYAPRMIPLFAVPNPDGRASGRQMEGSIHGPESVQEIVPRLHTLLGS